MVITFHNSAAAEPATDNLNQSAVSISPRQAYSTLPIRAILAYRYFLPTEHSCANGAPPVIRPALLSMRVKMSMSLTAPLAIFISSTAPAPSSPPMAQPRQARPTASSRHLVTLRLMPMALSISPMQATTGYRSLTPMEHLPISSAR